MFTLTRAEIEAIVKTPTDGKGIDCRFYNVAEGVGLKVYVCRDKAIEMYAAQHFLANNGGYCPQCWGMGSIDGIQVYNGFGTYNITYFYTETVEVYWYMLCVAYPDNRWNEEERAACYYESSFEKKKALDIGFEIYDRFGFHFNEDMHENNFGYTKEGRLVFIDVGFIRSPMMDDKEREHCLKYRPPVVCESSPPDSWDVDNDYDDYDDYEESEKIRQENIDDVLAHLEEFM